MTRGPPSPENAVDADANVVSGRNVRGKRAAVAAGGNSTRENKQGCYTGDK